MAARRHPHARPPGTRRLLAPRSPAQSSTQTWAPAQPPTKATRQYDCAQQSAGQDGCQKVHESPRPPKRRATGRYEGGTKSTFRQTTSIKMGTQHKIPTKDGPIIDMNQEPKGPPADYFHQQRGRNIRKLQRIGRSPTRAKHRRGEHGHIHRPRRKIARWDPIASPTAKRCVK